MSLVSNERTFTIQNLKKITTAKLSSVFLILALIMPFFLFKRALPQPGFYSELTSAFLFSLFIFFASFSFKNYKTWSSNKASLFFLVIAAYLAFDALVNPPVYLSLHILYIGTLLLAALLAHTVATIAQNSNKASSSNQLFILVCYGLLAGALIQDIVIILQTLHIEQLSGWIYYIKKGGDYSGNLGQRNMAALYLTLGILATIYLLQTQRLSSITGWLLIIFQALILGAVNSRSLIMYLVAMLVILGVVSIWQRQLPKTLTKRIALTLAIVLSCQFITLPMLSLIQQDMSFSSTSMTRLAQSTVVNPRLAEWYKAWLIFIDNLWFGTGWNSYSYQGFIMTSDPRFPYPPPTQQLFTHSHSLIFNFLAEIGIIGTGIVLGSFAYLLTPLLKKSWRPETLIMVLMLTAFGIHNLVEFSLWYAYFFLIFVVLVTLLLSSLDSLDPNKHTFKENTLKLPPNIMQLLTSILTPVLAFSYSIMCINMYVNFYKLEQLYFKIGYDNTIEQRIETAQSMLKISATQPLITAYVDMTVASYFDAMPLDNVPNQFDSSFANSAHYQPIPIPSINYLIMQCHNGDWDPEQWTYYQNLKGYFPTQVPIFSVTMSLNHNCQKAFEKVHKDCKEYRIKQGDPDKSCVARFATPPDTRVFIQ